MSAAPNDWEGPNEPSDSAGVPPPAPVPAPSAPDPSFANPAESAEFKLGASSDPTDDSPTIISKASRKPRPEENITTSLRGRCLAHFDLLEPIGVGGMAAVIRAHDKQLDRAVALKILPPAMATDVESLRRFQHEARAAARLDHENIARVFYCGEDQGLHFIAFEFVEGDNLRVILDRRGQLPVPEAIKYMLQVATGLAHAASRGVVHRDIKPSNIIITPTGRAKLVDMGLARRTGLQGADAELTQSGVTLGTFDYISPEQALEPRDADVRSDIYSLGCTFYHMLTGQPPVPEGTAAKKLHHHQHVAPIDPRQLNPSIPDEVAAVVARMMAKDPKDRYQRPEHLVQHLMQLAQKMTGTQLPEGVLFVDAPLPGPPSSGPLLIGGIAAAVLVALIVLLGSLPSGTPPSDTGIVDLTQPAKAPPPAKDDSKKTAGPGVTKTTQPQDKVPPRPAPPITYRIVAQTTRDLADALKHPVVNVQLPGKPFDLRLKRADGEVAGLVFQGESLTIAAQDETKRPRLFLSYDASGKDFPWTALTVAGGQVTFVNIIFEIDATGTETPMTALLRTGGRVRFENCEFVQKNPPPESDKSQLRSLVVAGVANEGNDGQPDVILDRCYFRTGHEAIEFMTAANAQLKDCAFAPHTTLFHFQGSGKRDSRRDEAVLRLRHCTAMLSDRSTVFLLSDDASARLIVSHCLFSNPGPDAEGAVLVRQDGEVQGTLRFEPEFRNVYHNLGAFWVQGSRVQSGDLEEFRRDARIDPRDRSASLALSPWEMDKPIDGLSHPEKAFRASQDVAELRQLDQPKSNMVGVEVCTWGKLYPGKLRGLKEKIVDDTVRESGHGVYPTLLQAILESQSGDTIKIKVNGPVVVPPPVRLDDRPEPFELTIKPEDGFKPIVRLGSTMDPENSAMFRFGYGKLTLENLEFELPVPPTGLKAQCLVYLSGPGECVCKNCLFTLRESKDGRVPRSLFVLPDQSSVMRKDPKTSATGVPRISLKSCFVRGDGDLVTVRGSQAFTLDVDDSLLALDGSLLIVDGSGKEVMTNPWVKITLNKMTAFLSEPLLRLRTSEVKPPGLVPTHMTNISNCVIATPRERKALIHLEGMESDDQMKRLFFWDDGKHNVYSGFQNMLEQRPRGADTVMLSQYDRARWADFASKEADPRYDKITFESWPVDGRSLSTSLASHFRIKTADLIGFGADVERLPAPSAEKDPEPSTPSAESPAKRDE